LAQILTTMKNDFWNSAAVNGLFVALVSIVFILIRGLFPMFPSLAKFSFVFTIIKLIGTIGILFYFMKQYSQEQESFSYGDGFRYGFVVSLCSAIVLAAYACLHYVLLFPDSLDAELEAIKPLIEQFGAQSSFDFDLFITYKLPIKIFGEFFNPLVWGLIIPAILANFTKNELPLFDSLDK